MKTKTSPASANGSSGSWKILAADDDESSRELSRLVLSRAGYLVDTVNDGEDAWQALLSNHYDLLLTDQNMPCLTGLELVARIRNAGMTLPVIIHSGCVELEEAPGCKALHLTVLQKTTGFVELVGAVENVLPLPADTDMRRTDSAPLLNRLPSVGLLSFPEELSVQTHRDFLRNLQSYRAK